MSVGSVADLGMLLVRGESLRRWIAGRFGHEKETTAVPGCFLVIAHRLYCRLASQTASRNPVPNRPLVN